MVPKANYTLEIEFVFILRLGHRGVQASLELAADILPLIPNAGIMDKCQHIQFKDTNYVLRNGHLINSGRSRILSVLSAAGD